MKYTDFVQKNTDHILMRLEALVSILGFIRISVNFSVELSHVALRLDILLMTASSYTTGLLSPDSFSPPAVVRITTEAMTFDE